MIMKKMILFTALLTISTLLMAQVPDKIINQFKSSFPEANEVQWSTNENGYKALFRDSKRIAYAVYYDKSGVLRRKENEVVKSDIPFAISDYCKRNYPKENSCKLWISEEQDGKKLYSMDRGIEIIYFDTDGNYLNKKKATSK